MFHHCSGEHETNFLNRNLFTESIDSTVLMESKVSSLCTNNAVLLCLFTYAFTLSALHFQLSLALSVEAVSSFLEYNALYCSERITIASFY